MPALLFPTAAGSSLAFLRGPSTGALQLNLELSPFQCFHPGGQGVVGPSACAIAKKASGGFWFLGEVNLSTATEVFPPFTNRHPKKYERMVPLVLSHRLTFRRTEVGRVPPPFQELFQALRLLRLQISHLRLAHGTPMIMLKCYMDQQNLWMRIELIMKFGKSGNMLTCHDRPGKSAVLKLERTNLKPSLWPGCLSHQIIQVYLLLHKLLTTWTTKLLKPSKLQNSKWSSQTELYIL